MRSEVTALGSPSIGTLRALHRLRAEVDAEAEQPAPGVTSATFADFASTIRQPPHGVRVDHFIARGERNALAGWATLTIRDDASLQGVGKFNMEVPARMRRGGVGTALLDAIRTQARLYEVTNLYAWAPIGTAGAGFLANVLDRPRSEEIWSVLDLRRSPVPVVAPRDDLKARCWSGPCPPNLLTAFAAVHRAVGASVRGSEAGSEHVTASLLAALESDAASEGVRWLSVVALERRTGMVVGFSQIELPRDGAQVAHQQFTGVDPVWRRRGVARWMKAFGRGVLRDEYPEVGYVTTENADDNAAIRALNISMGFRVYRHLLSWQEAL